MSNPGVTIPKPSCVLASEWWRRCTGCARLMLFACLVAAAGRTASAEEPAARVERLEEHWRLLLPHGAGPHPAALLLSGCDGVRDNMEYWARFFVAHGYAALILDSHTPRGLARFEAWRLVCAGIALRGAKRAGDIATAIRALTQRDDITDSVTIFGVSHGGWAAMEFVAHVAERRTPPGLADWPAPPVALMDAVLAMVLLYPYCGALNGAEPATWRGAPPTLMVLAAKDTIVSAPACITRARRLRGTGAVVETAVIPDADHGFDQRLRSPLSSLEFRPDQRSAAAGAVAAFLARHRSPP